MNKTPLVIEVDKENKELMAVWGNYSPDELTETKSSSRSYNSLSGVDIKVFARFADRTEKPLPTLQAISLRETVNRTRTTSVKGSIVYIVFEDNDLRKELDGTFDLLLKGIVDNGAVVCLEIKGVSLTSSSWGFSVDDIVLEGTLEFEALGVTSWTKFSK